MRRPADLRDPERLLRIAVARHQVAQSLDVRVHRTLGGARMRVGVDVHDVEELRAAQAVDLLDEVERDTGRAAERDTQRRVVRLGDLVGPAQHGEVVRRVRVLPESGDVLLVPHLQDGEAAPVVRDDAPDVRAPGVQVVVCGMRPRDGIAQDRQQLDAVRLAGGHDGVERGEVPFAGPAFKGPPVEVAAHPAKPGLPHERTRARRRLAARHVRARAIGVVCRGRPGGKRRKGQKGQGGPKSRKMFHVPILPYSSECVQSSCGRSLSRFFRDRLSRFLSRTQQTPGGKRDGISRGDREGRVWAVDEDADREGAERKKNNHNRLHQSKWSERRDLNPRPFGPEPNALPDCATLRGENKEKYTLSRR